MHGESPDADRHRRRIGLSRAPAVGRLARAGSRGHRAVAEREARRRRGDGSPPSVGGRHRASADGPRVRSVRGADAVVNLAGVVDRRAIRGRAGRKRAILRSRLDATAPWSKRSAGCPPSERPRVLVNASGDRRLRRSPDGVVTEDSVPGISFLAGVVDALGARRLGGCRGARAFASSWPNSPRRRPGGVCLATDAPAVPALRGRCRSGSPAVSGSPGPRRRRRRAHDLAVRDESIVRLASTSCAATFRPNATSAGSIGRVVHRPATAPAAAACPRGSSLVWPGGHRSCTVASRSGDALAAGCRFRFPTASRPATPWGADGSGAGRREGGRDGHEQRIGRVDDDLARVDPLACRTRSRTCRSSSGHRTRSEHVSVNGRLFNAGEVGLGDLRGEPLERRRGQDRQLLGGRGHRVDPPVGLDRRSSSRRRRLRNHRPASRRSGADPLGCGGGAGCGARLLPGGGGVGWRPGHTRRRRRTTASDAIERASHLGVVHAREDERCARPVPTYHRGHARPPEPARSRQRGRPRQPRGDGGARRRAARAPGGRRRARRRRRRPLDRPASRARQAAGPRADRSAGRSGIAVPRAEPARRQRPVRRRGAVGAGS